MSPLIKHFPVMCSELVDHVVKKEDGFYVDCTFGQGGHSREILRKLGKNGRLIACDLDLDAYELGKKLEQEDSRFRMFHSNFSDLQNILRNERFPKVDGIIFDLGASLDQLKNPKKGFSYMHDDERLDMRMDRENIKHDATHILNHYTRNQLTSMFRKNGEISDPQLLVHKISNYRKSYNQITTVGEFKALIKNAYRNRDNISKIIRKCFQALRIEVNKELESLSKALSFLESIVNSDGYVGFITFHSLEHKKILEWGVKNCNPILIEDYGLNPMNKFLFVTEGYIHPSSEEIQDNLASMNAKMWIAKKAN